MEPRVKHPARLRSPWPPTDALQPQPVTPWDDWWSLQTHFKRDEVWDIIYYNFETYDTDEVNWYLREFLGCRATTIDGLNYRFGRASGDSNPIIVYIPTWDWLPPGPQQREAKQAVLAVLRDPVAANLHFKIGSMEVKPGDMALVADAIERGRIRIIHRPSMGHMAAYDSSRNRMAIPFARQPNVGDRSLIVHECVHAVMDIRRVAQTMQQAEGMAYVAQALYLKRNGLNLANTVVTPPFAVLPGNFVAWTGIFSKAAAVAIDIDNGVDVSFADLLLLGISLDLTDTYSHEAAPANDGI